MTNVSGKHILNAIFELKKLKESIVTIQNEFMIKNRLNPYVREDWLRFNPYLGFIVKSSVESVKHRNLFSNTNNPISDYLLPKANKILEDLSYTKEILQGIESGSLLERLKKDEGKPLLVGKRIRIDGDNGAYIIGNPEVGDLIRTVTDTSNVRKIGRVKEILQNDGYGCVCKIVYPKVYVINAKNKKSSLRKTALEI